MAKTNGQAWLAEKLGVSQQRVSKLVASPDWPFGRGPWKAKDVPAINAHMQDRRAENPATVSDVDVRSITRDKEKQAKIELLIERGAKIKVEREQLEGCYFKKDQVFSAASSAGHALRAKLQEMPLRASLLYGRSEFEIEAILYEWMKEACDYLASSKWATG